MITVKLTSEQAKAIANAVEIIHSDSMHDSCLNLVPLWEAFDSKMCLDDLVEAKRKIEEAAAEQQL